jgi:hypothetical protein
MAALQGRTSAPTSALAEHYVAPLVGCTTAPRHGEQTDQVVDSLTGITGQIGGYKVLWLDMRRPVAKRAHSGSGASSRHVSHKERGNGSPARGALRHHRRMLAYLRRRLVHAAVTLATGTQRAGREGRSIR